MTFEEHRHSEVRESDEAPTPRGREVVHGDRVVESRLSTAELLSRLVIFVFGLIQLVIALRIFFLAIGAREGNDIVAFVLDISRSLVDPFVGMIGPDALRSSGSVLDVTALLALVGWTVLEVIVIAFVRLLRRAPA